MKYKVLIKMNRAKFVEVGLGCLFTSLLFTVFLNGFSDMTENDLLQATAIFLSLYYLLTTIFGFSLISDKILACNENISLFIYQNRKQKLYLNKLKIIDIIYTMAFAVSIIMKAIRGKLSIEFIITSFFISCFFVTLKSVKTIKLIVMGLEEIMIYVNILFFGLIIFEYYNNHYILLLGGMVYFIINILIHIITSKWRYKDEDKKLNRKLFE